MSAFDEAADLARGALEDQVARERKNSGAGSTAWKTREPKIAAALLAVLDLPISRSGMTSLKARFEGEVRLLQEEVARLNGENRELRFQRDKARLAYVAAYELAEKIAVECADPERIEEIIRDRMVDLRPEENG